MFNTKKLKGKIAELYGSADRFSMAVSCSADKVYKYLQGKSTLRQDDIDEWAKALEIEPEEIPIYFFTTNVDESELK